VGNLVNRTLVFAWREFAGKAPEGKLSQADNEFVASQGGKFSKAGELLERVQIKEALHLIMQAGKEANAYFQKNEPWRTAKEDKAKCSASIYVLLNQVKDFAIALEPFIPHTSATIFKQLAIAPRKWNDLGKLSLPAGHALGKPEILFRKIEQKELEGFAARYGGTQKERDEKAKASAPKHPSKEQKPKAEKPAPAPVAPISETEIDFEVGKIIEIARHPNAEKLYVEKVQMGGGEVRQIVSGLVPYFQETELLGKSALIVKNLKAATLRGVESQGMLLAAENAESKLELVSPQNEPGAKAAVAGAHNKPPAREITIDQFFTVKLEVKAGALLANGKPLQVGGKPILLHIVKDGKVR